MDRNSHGAIRDSSAVSAQWREGLAIDPFGSGQPREASLTVLPGPRLVAMFDEESIGAEKFRLLASRLEYLRKKRPLKKVVVTSTVKGEGKSVVSANLAATLGRRHKTLLIDGDLRQSGLVDLFGSHDRSGLSDWWNDALTITSLLLRIETLNLWHLPAGQAASHPLEMLQSQRTAEMLSEVAESFDWVIIDAPPLILADPNLWATLSDGTLLVVKQGSTPKRLLQKSLDSIENLKLAGVVMNGSQDAANQYYGQYYKGLPRTVVSKPARQLDPAKKEQF